MPDFWIPSLIVFAVIAAFFLFLGIAWKIDESNIAYRKENTTWIRGKLKDANVVVKTSFGNREYLTTFTFEDGRKITVGSFWDSFVVDPNREYALGKFEGKVYTIKYRPFSTEPWPEIEGNK